MVQKDFLVFYSAYGKEIEKDMSDELEKKETGESTIKSNSIRKIAVLFTDIVGSSRFFKSHGNMAGLNMLRKHHRMVPPIIEEHNGVVVKFLGDSVLAYFSEPVEALKSAIRIQKLFLDYNKEKEPDSQIHIKIAVHYGEGIIDKGDIYGDVVNVAAKLIEMVNGDEVHISEAVYKEVKNLSPIIFESINVQDGSGLLNGIKRYVVKWDKDVDLKPSGESLILVKPLWELASNDFKKIWKRFKRDLNKFMKKDIKKSKSLKDGSLLIIADNNEKILRISERIKNTLYENTAILKEGILPVYIVLDTGVFLKDEDINEPGNIRLIPEELEPGEINVSIYFLKKIKDRPEVRFHPYPIQENNRSFYKLITSVQQDVKYSEQLFNYQEVLRRGSKAPCFYCNARTHTPSKCPSKQLPALTKVLDQIGYMDFDEINRIFFNFITTLWAGKSPGRDIRKSCEIALHALFDINRAFQLRTMELVWDTREDERWDRVIKRKSSTNHGGLVWLGKDCIRVSNLVKAKDLLTKAIEKSPHEFRAKCLMGFVYIERGDVFRAMGFFKDALETAHSISQKIYALFLLFRIYQVMDDIEGQKESLREILKLDPSCSDAIYQDILISLREERTSEAEGKLRSLIERERRYFPISLIDPQLSPYKGIIHTILGDILKNTINDAERFYKRAGDEIKKCDNILLEEERNNLIQLHNSSRELIESGTYFACLDAIHHCNIIIEKCTNSVKDMRRNITKLLSRIDNMIDSYSDILNRFPFPFLVKGFWKKLGILKGSVKGQWAILGKNVYSRFKESHKQCLELLNEARSMGVELNRRIFVGRIIQFGIDFLKKGLLFELINLLLAIIIFPVVIHYVLVFFPSLNITTSNFWYYQKIIIYIGGLIALLLAVLISAKNQKDEILRALQK